jgi:hypothetical protein
LQNNCDEAFSSYSETELDERTLDNHSNAGGSTYKTGSRPQCPGNSVISILSLEVSVEWGNEIPYVIKDAVPVTIFILFFSDPTVGLINAMTSALENNDRYS